jgi:hypothetical protein
MIEYGFTGAPDDSVLSLTSTLVSRIKLNPVNRICNDSVVDDSFSIAK